MTDKIICTRCIYDQSVESISFDEKGVCNYCNQISELSESYGTGKKKGEEAFNHILNEIRVSGEGKEYDCVIGVSGGTDSSYLIHLAVKEWNLRPLAVHYDNTWNAAISTINISTILKKLNVDLHTHVVNNKEADDIFKSFFLAGVPEIEASTDLGYAYTLRKAAKKYGIKYILEGHSFIEEGITPLGKNYFDGGYIKSIHKLYGTMKIKSYPLMTFWRFVGSIVLDRVKFIRPLWYISYSKSDAQKLLEENYGWKYYGGHHLENRMSAFLHSVYSPRKFKRDFRNNTLSAMVRNGYLSREEALKEYNSEPFIEPGLEEYFRKRMGLSYEGYEEIINAKGKYWHEFYTYKKRFELLKPMFYIFLKLKLIPESFYKKYCFSMEIRR